MSILKITLRVSSSTNLRIFVGTGKRKIDHGDEIGKRVMRKKLSKVNPSEIRFLTLKTSVAFTYFRKTYIEALILHYFDQKRYIRIETVVSSFAISRIFNQLTLRYVTQTNPDLLNSKIS